MIYNTLKNNLQSFTTMRKHFCTGLKTIQTSLYNFQYAVSFYFSSNQFEKNRRFKICNGFIKLLKVAQNTLLIKKILSL